MRFQDGIRKYRKGRNDESASTAVQDEDFRLQEDERDAIRRALAAGGESPSGGDSSEGDSSGGGPSATGESAGSGDSTH